MTPFEDQVADALLAAMPESGSDNEWWWHERIREALAPRVAAAIEAAIYRAFDAHIDGYELGVAQSSGHHVALAALRGEP